MTSPTREELLGRSCLEGWRYCLWAVALTIGAALLAYLTFRVGLASTFDDLSTLWLLVICVFNLVVFWRARRATGTRDKKFGSTFNN